jgi:3-oxoacyl-[acyl-carrier protein] reductase
MGILTGKVILVTGASRGIGAAVAIKLAEAGASVIANYAESKAGAEQVVNTIRENGGAAIAVKADVSDPQQVKALFDAAIAEYGKLDVLINNAGVMFTKMIKDTTDEDFDWLFNINVKGVFNTLREAASRLADHGSIINFSTSANRMLLPGYAAYVASKAAVEQFTRIFAKEVGGRGINVNSLSPGPTDTELFANGKTPEAISKLASMSAFNRIATPEDIARVVVFLASDDAKWITAQNIGANGGVA